MGLRSGRIDVFDSTRGAFGRLRQYAKGRAKIKKAKDQMIIHLCKVTNRVAKNTEKYKPESTTEELNYYKNYIDFLTELQKDRKIDLDNLDKLTKLDAGNDCEKATVTAVKKFSSGSQTLKDKAIIMLGEKSNPRNELGWLKALTKGVKQGKVSSALSNAKSKKAKLEGADMVEKYTKATKALEKVRKELYKFKRTTWQWFADKLTRFDDSIPDEDEGGLDKSAEKDTKNFMYKVKKSQDKYTKITDKAIDVLIDIRDSVNEENKRKIITVRDERVFIQISKLNVKDRKAMKLEKSEVLKELKKSFKEQSKK